MKVAIITDSNSGITQAEAKSLQGGFVIPMPFIVNDEEFFEDINLSQEEFYQKLAENADISTSQPSIGAFTELWDEVLKEYDEIVHIPMSSGLSKSCETATNFAKEYNGKVQVVDNKRISVTQKQAFYDAIKLAEEGKSAYDIKEYLESTSMDASIYIMVSTLKYLKKGGRITPTAAAIGTMLNIKPVLQIQGGKLDSFAKVMNEKVAKNKMIEAAKKDIENRFKSFVEEGKFALYIAHTNCPEKAELFAEQVKAEFPNIPVTMVDPLSLSVACHIGSGSIALAMSRTL